MLVKEVLGTQDRDSWSGWNVCLVPSDPDARFRIIGTQLVGTEVRIKGIVYAVASQLPWQREYTTLLDMHLPPDPGRPNVRSSGGYTLRLTLNNGETIITNGAFEEFTPDADAAES